MILAKQLRIHPGVELARVDGILRLYLATDASTRAPAHSHAIYWYEDVPNSAVVVYATPTAIIIRPT